MKNFIRKAITSQQKQRYLLAMEYGITMSEVALKQWKDVTPEMVKKLEEMFISECERSTDQQLALNMIPNILSIFET